MPKNTPSTQTPRMPNAANPASAGGGAVAPCHCANAKVTSQTVATVPSNRARTRLGVGESTLLTYSLGAATWTMSPPDPEGGSLSSTSGASVTYTAPDRATSVTITATGGGCTKTITLTIVEPSSIRMERRPGTRGNHTINTASVGFIADIYVLPADVSFEHCSYLESEVDAVGTGCFQQFYANNHVGHHPNTSPIPIGPPVSDTSGSKVNGFDKIAASGSKCNGGWTWSIPWLFRVGGGTDKQFTTVDQVVAITAAGAADISKAGASNHANSGDATDVDPLF
jgi:hypothetical protein